MIYPETKKHCAVCKKETVFRHLFKREGRDLCQGCYNQATDSNTKL